MKKVKQYVAIAAAALMMTSIVPNKVTSVAANAAQISNTVRSSNAEPDFLILVGESVYSDIKDNLDIYMADILKEQGLKSEVIRISRTIESGDVNKCTKPQEVKEIIKRKYNNGNGAKGFVIIGSGNDIPSAFVSGVPSDLYFADMSNDRWIEADSTGNFVSGSRGPEMYFGRIDTRGIADYMNQDDADASHTYEAKLINSYLERVHNYRINGGNLNDIISNRGLAFVENRTDEKEQNTPLNRVVSNIEGVYDDDETCKENWLKKLNKGYSFIFIRAHGDPDWSAFPTTGTTHYSGDIYLPKGDPKRLPDENYCTLDDILKNDKVNPKFNFMDLDCCTTCKYEEANRKPLANVGAAYLFKETSTGLNITGGTTDCSDANVDESFYEELSKGTPVGQAFKDESVGMISTVLLGDPTVKYKITKPVNKAPNIINNFSLHFGGNTESTKPMPLTINANHAIGIITTDDDSEDIDYIFAVDGRPTPLEQHGKYLYWIPDSRLVGEPHKCYIKVFNNDADGNQINSYTENFYVDVKSENDRYKTIYQAESSNNTISNGQINGNIVTFNNNNNCSIKFNNLEPVLGTLNILVKSNSAKGKTANVILTDKSDNEYNTTVKFDNNGVGFITQILHTAIKDITIKSDGNGLPDIDCIYVTQ